MSKPKLLTKLKIGGDTYKVFQHNKALTSPSDETPVWGYMDSQTHEIHLGGDIPEHRRDEIFLHEIFHAICNSFRINLSDDQEEQLALQFGLGYAQALAGLVEFPEP